MSNVPQAPPEQTAWIPTVTESPAETLISLITTYCQLTQPVRVKLASYVVSSPEEDVTVTKPVNVSPVLISPPCASKVKT